MVTLKIKEYLTKWYITDTNELKGLELSELKHGHPISNSHNVKAMAQREEMIISFCG